MITGPSPKFHGTRDILVERAVLMLHPLFSGLGVKLDSISPTLSVLASQRASLDPKERNPACAHLRTTREARLRREEVSLSVASRERIATV